MAARLEFIWHLRWQGTRLVTFHRHLQKYVGQNSKIRNAAITSVFYALSKDTFVCNFTNWPVHALLVGEKIPKSLHESSSCSLSHIFLCIFKHFQKKNTFLLDFKSIVLWFTEQIKIWLLGKKKSWSISNFLIRQQSFFLFLKSSLLLRCFSWEKDPMCVSSLDVFWTITPTVVRFAKITVSAIKRQRSQCDLEHFSINTSSHLKKLG